jgi:hypothetical protein
MEKTDSVRNIFPGVDNPVKYGVGNPGKLFYKAIREFHFPGFIIAVSAFGSQLAETLASD